MKLVKLPIKAPTPLMIESAAEVFNALRKTVLAGSGIDFMGKAGDVFRDATFRSKKDGVANRSWHKTGRAFDYDQESKNIVIVKEPKGGKMYFRTYLRCADQTGVQGKKMQVKDMRGHWVDAYLYDFTAAAEQVAFMRIPAWNGWAAKGNYNRREFWHYQYNPEGLTWDGAMLQLKGKSRPVAEKVLGLNDRGADVRAVQKRLIDLKFLAPEQLDGVYGTFTKAATEGFQAANGLSVDGLVGPLTRKALGL